MFYLMMHSAHIYCYMASVLWKRTFQIAKEETCCLYYMSNSFQLATRVLLMHNPTAGTAHTMAFSMPVMEHWLK